MTHRLNLLDRLRIERIVWSLDQRTYDLPRRTRIDMRREVRANLLSAAQDVGTTAALRQIGSGRRLAEEYLTAEFGEGPRHSWLAAGVFAATTMLIATSLVSETANAFGDGLRAVGVSGVYSWHGIGLFQDSATFTVTGHQVSFTGGGLSALSWLLWIAGTVLVGRLWRIPSVRRRRTAARALSI